MENHNTFLLFFACVVCFEVFGMDVYTVFVAYEGSDQCMECFFFELKILKAPETWERPKNEIDGILQWNLFAFALLFVFGPSRKNREKTHTYTQRPGISGGSYCFFLSFFKFDPREVDAQSFITFGPRDLCLVLNGLNTNLTKSSLIQLNCKMIFFPN